MFYAHPMGHSESPSDHKPLKGFKPTEKDDKGRLVAEHEDTGWTIAARNPDTLERMAGFVRRAARLRMESDGL